MAEENVNEAQNAEPAPPAAPQQSPADSQIAGTAVVVATGGAASASDVATVSDQAAAAMRYYGSNGADPLSAYDPVSPFRLSFTFDSNGNYTAAQVHDPEFVWQYSDAQGKYSVQEVTATVDNTLPVTEQTSVWLYIALVKSGADAGKVSTALVSVRSNVEGYDAKIRLYKLSSTDGVVLDLRHALLTLGGGGGGGGADWPWTFVPDEDSGEGTFAATGTWTNAFVAIGHSEFQNGDTMSGTTFTISGLHGAVQSGRYYLDFSIDSGTWSVGFGTGYGTSGSSTPSGYTNPSGTLHFFIGTLNVNTSARTITQTRHIYTVPRLPVYI